MNHWTEPLIGPAVLTLGCIVLLHALIARRIPFLRARARRCPKCRYDLSHTEGRQCPECGRQWRYESSLYAQRRRRLEFALAFLLLALSVPAFRAEAIADRGWIAGIPTTALIAASPWSLPAHDAATARGIRRSAGTAPEWMKRVGVPLADELRLRAAREDLHAWQWWLLTEVLLRIGADETELDFGTRIWGPPSVANRLMRRAIADGHLTERQTQRLVELVSLRPAVPSAWPVGAEMTGELHVWPWLPLEHLRVTLIDPATDRVLHTQTSEPRPFIHSLHADLWSPASNQVHVDTPAEPGAPFGRAPDGSRTIPYRVRVEPMKDGMPHLTPFERTVTIDVTGRGTVADHVTAMSSPTVTAAFDTLDARIPRGGVGAEGSVTRIGVNSAAFNRALVDAKIDVFAAVLEVCAGSEVIATREACWWVTTLTDDVGEIVGASGVPDIEERWSEESIAVQPTDLTPDRRDASPRTRRPPYAVPLILRIRSAPHLAIPVAAPITCWEGDITIPLRIEDDPRNAASVAIEREAHRDD